MLAYQRRILNSHAGGFGVPLASELVRAAMAARLNGIARGGAGATAGTVETLAAMLNAGVHPIVPEIGSVGAADLAHMAAIGSVAIGIGTAEFEGVVISAAEAMRLAGIQLLVPQPKDGLALISANSMSIGHGALVLQRILEIADIVLVLSLESIDGNLSIIDPEVSSAKLIAGQAEAIKHLNMVLEGSRLHKPGVAAVIQDPLSFRVGPQVHGALRETMHLVEHAVATELNARADNPLFANGRIIHNGNFAPMMLALGFDYLRPAPTHVAKLSERRMSLCYGRVHLTRCATSAAGRTTLRSSDWGLAFIMPRLQELARCVRWRAQRASTYRRSTMTSKTMRQMRRIRFPSRRNVRRIWLKFCRRNCL